MNRKQTSFVDTKSEEEHEIVVNNVEYKETEEELGNYENKCVFVRRGLRVTKKKKMRILRKFVS